MNLADFQLINKPQVDDPLRRFAAGPVTFPKQGGSTLDFATPRQKSEAQRIAQTVQEKVITPAVNAVTDPFYAMTPGTGQRRQEARRRILEKVTAAATDPMMGTFAGVNAKLADKAALAKSLEMKAAGIPDREIWRQTGWTHGFPDGKARFEIDDSGLAYTPNDNVTYGVVGEKGSRYQQERGQMGDLYTHEELFNNYPAVANIEGVMGLGLHSPSGGSYNRLFGITANGETEKTANYNAIHELQHAVQEKENFAKGGNPAVDDMYTSLAGEVESRLTQRRMALDAAQRRERYPLDDMDVKPEDQIVRFK